MYVSIDVTMHSLKGVIKTYRYVSETHPIVQVYNSLQIKLFIILIPCQDIRSRWKE